MSVGDERLADELAKERDAFLAESDWNSLEHRVAADKHHVRLWFCLGDSGLEAQTVAGCGDDYWAALGAALAALRYYPQRTGSKEGA